LLSYGCELQPVDKEGNTPLHLACKSGSFLVSSLLISKGASLEFENRYGETPLFLAKKFGHERLVESLTQSPPPPPPPLDLNVAEMHWDPAEQISASFSPETRTCLLFDRASMKHATYPFLSPLPSRLPKSPPPENTERLQVLLGEHVCFILYSFVFCAVCHVMHHVCVVVPVVVDFIALLLNFLGSGISLHK
jgi:Ankyrin repeats (3 copies)